MSTSTVSDAKRRAILWQYVYTVVRGHLFLYDVPRLPLSGAERPELHKLHNRSGELWSPLVALAAFFEEEGQVEGLLDAISEAAEWDEQLSEGKALSDREEAVLQALEIMTRNGEEGGWLKASELRERVREIMGIQREQMGHAQWIGHVLNRLALTDRNRKKAYTGGQMYLIERKEVKDMMRRYNVAPIDGQ